jgi:hypothetical protein
METVETIKDVARELYFNFISNTEYRNKFVKELEERTVIDKRDLGFYCGYCGNFSKEAIAFSDTDRVIYPKGITHEFWIVNVHYDGCRGWE